MPPVASPSVFARGVVIRRGEEGFLKRDMKALFRKYKRVLGLHDQCLGYSGACRIDITDGRITHIILRTPWQSIELDWDLVKFDPGRDAFRLKAGEGD
jgi:hypothetical protein